MIRESYASPYLLEGRCIYTARINSNSDLDAYPHYSFHLLPIEFADANLTVIITNKMKLKCTGQKY